MLFGFVIAFAAGHGLLIISEWLFSRTRQLFWLPSNRVFVCCCFVRPAMLIFGWKLLRHTSQYCFLWPLIRNTICQGAIVLMWAARGTPTGCRMLDAGLWALGLFLTPDQNNNRFSVWVSVSVTSARRTQRCENSGSDADWWD